ncbi:hypothetical protein APV28_3931 [Comamonas testosteroni]|nr:hypothetical protein APV28_3931 [Comamonas testosteroni]
MRDWQSKHCRVVERTHGYLQALKSRESALHDGWISTKRR